MLRWWHGHEASEPQRVRYRYHLVWAPKYRKWVLRGEIRERVKCSDRDLMTFLLDSYPLTELQTINSDSGSNPTRR